MSHKKKREAFGQFVASLLLGSGKLYPSLNITGTKLFDSIEFTIDFGPGEQTIIGYVELFLWNFADKQDRAGCSEDCAYKSLLKHLGLVSPWDLLDEDSKISSASKPTEVAIKTEDASCGSDTVHPSQEFEKQQNEVIELSDDSEDELGIRGSKVKAVVPAVAAKAAAPTSLPALSESTSSRPRAHDDFLRTYSFARRCSENQRLRLPRCYS